MLTGKGFKNQKQDEDALTWFRALPVKPQNAQN
jgi:hypothetical protein